MTSPTEITTYQSCQRKWAWRYIAGIKEPQKPSQILGSAVHKEIELWYGGRDPLPLSKAGKAAIAGIPFLPPRGPQVEVEKPFELFVGDVRFNGIKDVATEGPVGSEYRILVDHKTTSDQMWIKSVSTLRSDVQAIIYAYDEVVRWQKTAVYCRWVYYVMKGSSPKACPVDFYFTRPELDLLIKPIVETVQQMAESRKKSDPMEFPASVEHCAAYGGCFYRDKCNIPARELLRSVMGIESLKDKFMRNKNGQAAPAPAPAPAVPVMPPPSTTELETVETPSASEAAAPVAPSGRMPIAQRMAIARAEALARATGVNPPASTAAVAPPPPSPAPSPAPVAPAPMAVAEEPAPAPDVMDAEPRRRVGRPPGSRNKRRVESQPILVPAGTPGSVQVPTGMAVMAGAVTLQPTDTGPVVVAPPPPPPPAPAPVAPVALPPPPAPAAEPTSTADVHTDGLFLFVGCWPERGFDGVVHGTDFLRPTLEEVAKAAGAFHYRCIDYGKGVGLFQAALEYRLTHENCDGMVLYVDPRTQESIDALPVLERHAALIVRGR